MSIFLTWTNPDREPSGIYLLETLQNISTSSLTTFSPCVFLLSFSLLLSLPLFSSPPSFPSSVLNPDETFPPFRTTIVSGPLVSDGRTI